MKKFLNRYSKVIVAFSISFVSLYIIFNVILFYSTGMSIPDSITALVGGFFGVECGVLGWIKKSENNKSEVG